MSSYSEEVQDPFYHVDDEDNEDTEEDQEEKRKFAERHPRQGQPERQRSGAQVQVAFIHKDSVPPAASRTRTPSPSPSLAPAAPSAQHIVDSQIKGPHSSIHHESAAKTVPPMHIKQVRNEKYADEMQDSFYEVASNDNEEDQEERLKFVTIHRDPSKLPESHRIAANCVAGVESRAGSTVTNSSSPSNFQTALERGSSPSTTKNPSPAFIHKATVPPLAQGRTMSPASKTISPSHAHTVQLQGRTSTSPDTSNPKAVAQQPNPLHRSATTNSSGGSGKDAPRVPPSLPRGAGSPGRLPISSYINKNDEISHTAVDCRTSSPNTMLLSSVQNVNRRVPNEQRALQQQRLEERLRAEDPNYGKQPDPMMVLSRSEVREIEEEIGRQQFAQVVDKGFTLQASRLALKYCKNNVQAAINFCDQNANSTELMLQLLKEDRQVRQQPPTSSQASIFTRLFPVGRTSRSSSPASTNMPTKSTSPSLLSAFLGSGSITGRRSNSPTSAALLEQAASQREEEKPLNPYSRHTPVAIPTELYDADTEKLQEALEEEYANYQQHEGKQKNEEKRVVTPVAASTDRKTPSPMSRLYHFIASPQRSQDSSPTTHARRIVLDPSSIQRLSRNIGSEEMNLLRQAIAEKDSDHLNISESHSKASNNVASEDDVEIHHILSTAIDNRFHNTSDAGPSTTLSSNDCDELSARSFFARTHIGKSDLSSCESTSIENITEGEGSIEKLLLSSTDDAQ